MILGQDGCQRHFQQSCDLPVFQSGECVEQHHLPFLIRKGGQSRLEQAAVLRRHIGRIGRNRLPLRFIEFHMSAIPAQLCEGQISGDRQDPRHR